MLKLPGPGNRVSGHRGGGPEVLVGEGQQVGQRGAGGVPGVVEAAFGVDHRLLAAGAERVGDPPGGDDVGGGAGADGEHHRDRRAELHARQVAAGRVGGDRGLVAVEDADGVVEVVVRQGDHQGGELVDVVEADVEGAEAAAGHAAERAVGPVGD